MTSSFRPSSTAACFTNSDALPRRVEIERIDVEAVASRDQQIDFDQIVAEILCQAPHPITPVAQRDRRSLQRRISMGIFRRGDTRRRNGRQFGFGAAGFSG